jgi:hypothetical protein
MLQFKAGRLRSQKILKKNTPLRSLLLLSLYIYDMSYEND